MLRDEKLFLGKKAFTLVEFLIAMAVFAAIVGIGAPIVSDAYRGFQLSSDTQEFVNFLRMARNSATSGYGKSHFGLYVESGEFTYFKGDSYASRDRDFDLMKDLSNSVSVAGNSEVVFNFNSGIPAASGSWVFDNGHDTRNVLVNDLGTIFW